MYSSNNRGVPTVKLVATRLPEGFRLVDRVGVHAEPLRFRRFIESLSRGFPKGGEIVTAASIGLEWRYADNRLLSASADWQKTNWALIEPITLTDTHA